MEIYIFIYIWIIVHIYIYRIIYIYVYIVNGYFINQLLTNHAEVDRSFGMFKTLSILMRMRIPPRVLPRD